MLEDFDCNQMVALKNRLLENGLVAVKSYLKFEAHSVTDENLGMDLQLLDSQAEI